MKDKVKAFKKDKEKNNSKWNKTTQGNLVSEMQNIFLEAATETCSGK